MKSEPSRRMPSRRREESKVERKANILRAARMLFTELGYEAATLSQIASLAGLGKGTIFNYVTDKRDLIFLIFHEDVASLVEQAQAQSHGKQVFGEKILMIAELHYRLYAQNPKLSRILLAEAGFHSEGQHLDRVLQLRERIIKVIEQIVITAQEEGVVSRAEAPGFIARQIFFTFSMAAREWLTTPQPEWRAGLRQFKRILKLMFDGISTGR